jgi:hypothetical protein
MVGETQLLLECRGQTFQIIHVMGSMGPSFSSFFQVLGRPERRGSRVMLPSKLFGGVIATQPTEIAMIIKQNFVCFSSTIVLLPKVCLISLVQGAQRRVEAHGRNCFLDSAGASTFAAKPCRYNAFYGSSSRNSGPLR